ncbi:MAG: efflux RND transporter periplasmic adaptor subunit, partial [Bacteroidales bacterium]|nr:efflux RND transporter periplasmic adaptor subunit [Bacteroidales bacterium]
MRKLKNQIILIASIAFLSACDSMPESQGEELASSTESGIVLTQEQVRRAGITLGTIEKVMLSHDVNARGQVTVPPQARATVSAVMPGIIESIRVNPGEKVRKGEVLATYTHPGFITIQQEYLEQLNQLELLEKDYVRQKQLRDKNINSAKEFQEVEASYHRTKASVEAGKARLAMLHIDAASLESGNIITSVQILSPVAGVVNKVNANIGMSVEPGISLFHILNTSELLLQVKVFEKDMHLVGPGQRITFKTSGNNGEELVAHVTSVGAMVEDDTRTIEVLAAIENPAAGLIPGMFVSSKIHTSEQMLDALPEDAVIIENNNETYG